MRKYVIPIIVLTLFSFLLAGCGAGKDEGQKQPEKVRVLLDWTPNTNHTGVYVARERGYYQEQGLEVEIVQPSEGGTSQLIAAGQGEFGFSYQEELTVARTRGVPVVALAAVIQHNTSGFASPLDKGIKSPKDFEGKKYGGWGSPAEEAMIKALMDQENADFKQVEMINIGAADFFSSVKKDVDFAWIYWGWAGVESELRGMPVNFVRLIDYSDALDFYSPVLIAAEDMIKNNPDMVSRFIKATARGYNDCIREPGETGRILLDSVPELNRELVMNSQTYLAGEYRADAPVWGWMTEPRWKDYAAWMFDRGLIEKELDYQKAFTNDYLPKE